MTPDRTRSQPSTSTRTTIELIWTCPTVRSVEGGRHPLRAPQRRAGVAGRGRDTPRPCLPRRLKFGFRRNGVSYQRPESYVRAIITFAATLRKTPRFWIYRVNRVKSANTETTTPDHRF